MLSASLPLPATISSPSKTPSNVFFRSKATPITPRASNGAPTNRLLYRGALSLPDSHLLLDGLTFSARLESQAAEHELLENPLALALESMRGRPSLQFKGTVNMNEVWLDESGGIEMDIHPFAAISQIYFENTFCLLPLSSTPSSSSTPSKGQSQRSLKGIKVSLGDSDGPDTTEMIIFAELAPPATYPDQPPNALRLIVARRVPRPALSLSSRRLPRPDDPTPRKPPLAFIKSQQELFQSQPSARELKRTASSSVVGAGAAGTNKRPKLSKDSGKSDVKAGASAASFKVPNVPLTKSKSKSDLKGKAKEQPVDVDGDIFSMGNPVPASSSSSKDKKESENEAKEGETELERANKNLIKMSVVHQLSSVKDPTSATPSKSINKTHPEFKELFHWVYRGVAFALRIPMKIQAVDPLEVDRLVKAHIEMYVGGYGSLKPKGR
ncbi:hypothetical protein AX16_001542 [Volvariella volvacea WC 439]|nr:hypothetical protein AX16_001542 [Volvariella volvacea WC 439]